MPGLMPTKRILTPGVIRSRSTRHPEYLAQHGHKSVRRAAILLSWAAFRTRWTDAIVSLSVQIPARRQTCSVTASHRVASLRLRKASLGLAGHRLALASCVRDLPRRGRRADQGQHRAMATRAAEAARSRARRRRQECAR